MTKIHPISFLKSESNKVLLLITSIASFLYLIFITILFKPGNPFLFALLILGEIFHTWQAITYVYTVWSFDHHAKFSKAYQPPVDVFVTVAGEPVSIVKETIVNILAMDYPSFHVYILNDGFVAKKDNWEEIEELAADLGVNCITRKKAGGAKAGNINNALAFSSSPYVAIFDADHVPNKDFLKKTVGYFVDKKMGFVQTPQFYKNFSLNDTTYGAWEQQELFYGPICRGKNRLNSATMCGTNMVISREALEEAGGMCTESIAEDFATGLFIHEKGWKSLYVPEVLAKGLAPEDFLSYSKQQFRWARGALDVIFKYKLLTRKGLTAAQKIQYLSSVSFFFSGVVVLVNMLLPLIFLFTGVAPILLSGMLLATVFLPYMLLTIYNLSLTSNFRFTFRALSFSIGSFWIHSKAVFQAITGKKSGFSITSKVAVKGNFPELIVPHLLYIFAITVGIVLALLREGITPSVVNNIAWSLVNISVFIPFMLAAVPNRNWSLNAFFGFVKNTFAEKYKKYTETMPQFAEFLRFAATGIINTGVDFAILNILIYFIGLGVESEYYFMFKAISFAAAAANSFYFNKFWVFKNSKSKNNIQEIINFLSVTLIGLIINSFVSSFIFNFGQNSISLSSTAWANIGAIVGTIAVFMWNFVGYKLFVFKKPSSVIIHS